jgi:lipopolysaccharide export system protein LptC
MSALTLSPWMRVRRVWDRLSVYLPIVLMGLLALTTYWLVRMAPTPFEPELEAEPTHEPDYYMRDFTLKIYGGDGRLKSEVIAIEGRHYPDTDTLELDQPRIRTVNSQGRVTTARAVRGLSNADGSEVQLFENAQIVREAFTDAKGEAQPRSEIKSEFLHLFANTEQVKTHLPVVLIRGTRDQFTADHMDYDNLDRLMQLSGRVHGTIMPREKEK